MKLLFFVLTFLCLYSCSRFPYSGAIEESASFLKATYPKSFKSIDYQNEKIHYLSMGNPRGDLVVFIHGSPGSWKSFANFFKNERLLKQYQMITFDRFGFNQNRPGIPHGSLADQIIIPHEIVKHERGGDLSRSVIVVGHSYGGPVAVKYSLEYAREVSGLVLVAASVDPNLERDLWYQKIGAIWGIRSVIPSFLDVVNREIMALKKELVMMDSEYDKLNQPIYVIHGGLDKLVPKENVTYLQSRISHSKTAYKTLNNMKHFIPWAFPGLIEDGIQWVSKRIKTD